MIINTLIIKKFDRKSTMSKNFFLYYRVK